MGKRVQYLNWRKLFFNAPEEQLSLTWKTRRKENNKELTQQTNRKQILEGKSEPRANQARKPTRAT